MLNAAALMEFVPTFEKLEDLTFIARGLRKFEGLGEVQNSVFFEREQKDGNVLFVHDFRIVVVGHFGSVAVLQVDERR